MTTLTPSNTLREMKQTVTEQCLSTFQVPYNLFTVQKMKMILEDYGVYHPKRSTKENLFAALRSQSERDDIKKDLAMIRSFVLGGQTALLHATFSDFKAAQTKSRDQQERNVQCDLGSSTSSSVPEHLKRCTVCLEDYGLDMFPATVCTDSCDHEVNICTGCTSAHIDTRIETSPGNVSCPTCLETLSFEAVKLYASAEAFER